MSIIYLIQQIFGGMHDLDAINHHPVRVGRDIVRVQVITEYRVAEDG